MRATRTLSAVFLVAILCGTSAVGADPRLAPGYRVIVNAANTVEAVDRRFLSEAFFKKTTRWPNDLFVRPVDQSADSASRHAFSEDVLKRSVAAVKSYWQQMVFSGRGVPPPELDSDTEVVKFVVRNPGAIGYVSPAANVAGAKTIAVR